MRFSHPQGTMAITPPAFFTPNETCASGHHHRRLQANQQQPQRLSRQMLGTVSGSSSGYENAVVSTAAGRAISTGAVATGEEADEILGYYGFGLSGECDIWCGTQLRMSVKGSV
jgi:hypothetical protein